MKIRVRACSACGTDVKISRFGHQNITPPRVMGHEIAGEVGCQSPRRRRSTIPQQPVRHARRSGSKHLNTEEP
ncbi:MAG: alcohol dehydrogenase catalytic domain-containing protein [Devosia sp.]